MLSAYWISLPTDIPYASLEILTLNGFKTFAINIAVVSPSSVGLVAKITSLISLLFLMFKTSSFMLNCFGPIPLNGEIKPCKTWYLPKKALVLSKLMTSLELSTTHITLLSLFSSEQIEHILFSV